MTVAAQASVAVLVRSIFSRALVVGAIVLGCGCGAKPDGVMLVISTADDVPIAMLQVWVGEPVDVVFAGVDPFSDPHLSVHDILDEQPLSLEQRRLATTPYRYFLTGTSERLLSVGIVAASPQTGGDAQLYFGYLGKIEAAEGIVREYRVELKPVDMIEQDAQQCLHLFDGGDIFLTRGTDYDCDGFGEPRDCFPKNGNYHPNASDFCDSGSERVDGNCNGLCDEDSEDPENPGVASCGTLLEADEDGKLCVVADCLEPPDGPRLGEICDGYDTDCDPKTLPHDEATPCFGGGDGGCGFGKMSCIDENEQGANAETCGAEGDGRADLPESFCSAFDDCRSNSLPLECAFERLQIETVRCRVVVDVVNAAVCTPQIPVFIDNGGANECIVELLDARDEPFVTAQFDRTSFDECFEGMLSFGVNGDGTPPASFDLLLTKNGPAEPADVVRVAIDVVGADSCNQPIVRPLCDRPVAF